MIDIRLKVFSSVAHNLSFTKASKELYISQPAISKHIQELEHEYKTRLFDRMGNHIQLTRSGQLLLDHCEKILQLYQQMNFEMNALQKKYSGELRIGASTTISQYVIPEYLAKLLQTYPDLSVSMFSGNSQEIESELIKGRIDIGLVEGNIHQPELKYTPFVKDELVAIVSKDNPLATRDEITLEELKKQPLVIREIGSGTLDVIEYYLHQHDIHLSDLQIVMHFGTTEGIKQFVKKSNSMGIVSIRSISSELLRGEFKVIELKGVRFERTFSIVEKYGTLTGPAKMIKDSITKSYNL